MTKLYILTFIEGKINGNIAVRKTLT